jgi:hypothetical protein
MISAETGEWRIDFLGEKSRAARYVVGMSGKGWCEKRWMMW